MDILETKIETIGATRNISIPEEMFKSLGLHEGSRIAITLQQGKLLVSPLNSSLHEELERIRDLVAAAPGPSLSDLRMEMRQEERQRDLNFARKPLSSAQANALLDELSSMHAGQPALEDAYFRDREADKW